MQIKGDPSSRAQLFNQSRVESAFDAALDTVHDIVLTLLMHKSVFHTKIHHSSSQLTCRFARDPFCYEKFVREEVLEDGVLDRFPDADHAGQIPLIDEDHLKRLLIAFRRLRLSDEALYLRHAAVTLINGMINMSFSCDGAQYIYHKSFFSELHKFRSGRAAPTGLAAPSTNERCRGVWAGLS